MTVFISLVVSFLILADLQPLTNILILSCDREHAQQGIDKNVEKLPKRDTTFRYTCIEGDVALSSSFGASLTVALSYICSNKSTSGILNILVTRQSAA